MHRRHLLRLGDYFNICRKLKKYDRNYQEVIRILFAEHFICNELLMREILLKSVMLIQEVLVIHFKLFLLNQLTGIVLFGNKRTFLN